MAWAKPTLLAIPNDQLGSRSSAFGDDLIRPQDYKGDQAGEERADFLTGKAERLSATLVQRGCPPQCCGQSADSVPQ